MKCCDMHSGLLSAQIVIERLSLAGDGMGGNVDTWETEGTVWAMWRGKGGSEVWKAMRQTPENRFKAVIRWRGDANSAPYYSAKDRVKYQGRTYSIESVVDMDDRREWLDLTMIEGGKS